MYVYECITNFKVKLNYQIYVNQYMPVSSFLNIISNK